jgi:hypothetical protein
MAVTAKKSSVDMLAELEKSQADKIANAEIVASSRQASGSPFSVRLSAPLLERLERLARQEHRKRGNLIQHILWEYIKAHPVTE